MSAYLVLVAVLVAAVLVVVLLRIAHRWLAPAARTTVAEQPAARRAWAPVPARVAPVLTVLALGCAALPLLLWGMVLHDPGLRLGAFGAGTAVLATVAIGALHALRRGEVLP